MASCNKCGVLRTGGSVVVGDWLCGTAGCFNNQSPGVFRSKSSCNKCGASRTRPKPESGDWLCGTHGCVNNRAPGVFRSKSQCGRCGTKRDSVQEAPAGPAPPNPTVVEAEDSDCPICLESMEDATLAGAVVSLSCSHMCCAECWELWAESCSAKLEPKTCPLCRQVQ
eukprot:TRINITY_DN7634_c0_g1_i1.p1 TRINITY_DN7634_c0_g1~~TRINITY_DN7634_c0_g1_i1.p1  ORF type:complete len:168 (-),score=26.07 TRINITY_DN7634_c0_g1_i1:92-595(-)